MTGAEVSMFSYPDFLPGGMWKTMIEKEKITDLVVSDIMVTPEIWEEIKEGQREVRSSECHPDAFSDGRTDGRTGRTDL